MIERFFTTTATVKRQTVSTDGQGNKFSEFSTIGTVDGHKQQARPEVVENLNSDFTKTFTFWCAVDENVETGDTLVIGSDEFTVRAIQTNDTGKNEHLELIIEKS